MKYTKCLALLTIVILSFCVGGGLGWNLQDKRIHKFLEKTNVESAMWYIEKIDAINYYIDSSQMENAKRDLLKLREINLATIDNCLASECGQESKEVAQSYYKSHNKSVNSQP